MKAPAVYILASQRNGTLYIGVTSNLIQRLWQHREEVVQGFTQQYSVKTLVWYEQHETMQSAISREKVLKKWNRDWKLRLIEKRNPQWHDLWPEITGEAPPLPSTAAQLSSKSNAPSPSAENKPSSPSAKNKPSSPSAPIGDPAAQLDPCNISVEDTK